MTFGDGDDLTQDIEGGGYAIELSTAVVGNNNTIKATLYGHLGIFCGIYLVFY
jgi:hypothetical protein